MNRDQMVESWERHTAYEFAIFCRYHGPELATHAAGSLHGAAVGTQEQGPRSLSWWLRQ
jgi:hypothetical protein